MSSAPLGRALGGGDSLTGLKLLIVTAFFESHRGGIEIVAGRLARELARRGADVTWLATDASEPPSAPPVRTVSIGAANGAERVAGVPYPVPSPRGVAAIWREVRQADAVLVHDALYATSVAAVLAAGRFRKPAIVVQHIGAVPYRNPLLRSLMSLANRLVAAPILLRASQVVFISTTTERYFARLRFRRPPALVFNGVDTEVFAPVRDPEDRAAARREHGLPDDGPVALFVGRFVEKKGLPVLERLARARPDVTFALAGWGLEDPGAWKLPNVRVLAGLAGASLARLYGASDVLVLPSTGEGFPLVVQEALACGLPVLCGEESAAADPGATSLLTGIRVDPADGPGTASRFEEALARVLARGDAGDRVARISFARERYSWARVGDRYADLVKELAAAP